MGRVDGTRAPVLKNTAVFVSGISTATLPSGVNMEGGKNLRETHNKERA